MPPNETWVRQGVIEAIGGQPRRILDLGCGTGSMTMMLKQAFPQAEAIGMDLSCGTVHPNWADLFNRYHVCNNCNFEMGRD